MNYLVRRNNKSGAMAELAGIILTGQFEGVRNLKTPIDVEQWICAFCGSDVKHSTSTIINAEIEFIDGTSLTVKA